MFIPFPSLMFSIVTWGMLIAAMASPGAQGKDQGVFLNPKQAMQRLGGGNSSQKMWFNKGIPKEYPVFGNQNLVSNWWFQIFLFSHRKLGKWSILTNIFQMGWNHQLEELWVNCWDSISMYIYIYLYVYNMHVCLLNTHSTSCNAIHWLHSELHKKDTPLLRYVSLHGFLLNRGGGIVS